jgi:hypothetical protein
MHMASLLHQDRSARILMILWSDFAGAAVSVITELVMRHHNGETTCSLRDLQQISTLPR